MSSALCSVSTWRQAVMAPVGKMRGGGAVGLVLLLVGAGAGAGPEKEENVSAGVKAVTVNEVVAAVKEGEITNNGVFKNQLSPLSDDEGGDEDARPEREPRQLLDWLNRFGDMLDNSVFGREAEVRRQQAYRLARGGQLQAPR